MEISRDCRQNYGGVSVSFLLEEDYVQIRASWSHCLQQWDPVLQYYGHQLLQRLGSTNKICVCVHLQANCQGDSANKIILKILKKKLGDAKGL